jgi:hypothetical protein
MDRGWCGIGGLARAADLWEPDHANEIAPQTVWRIKVPVCDISVRMMRPVPVAVSISATVLFHDNWWWNPFDGNPCTNLVDAART